MEAVEQDVVNARADLVRRVGEPASRESKELWFTLAHLNWRSAVLVPADEGGSAATAATSLAAVGKELHEYPVTLFIMGDHPLDCSSAVQVITSGNTRQQVEGSGSVLGTLDYASAVQMVAAVASNKQNASGDLGPTGKVIAAIPPVITEPLGLAITQAADSVVLCIEIGRTRMSAARRTIDLVGRARIAGCVVIR